MTAKSHVCTQVKCIVKSYLLVNLSGLISDLLIAVEDDSVFLRKASSLALDERVKVPVEPNLSRWGKTQ